MPTPAWRRPASLWPPTWWPRPGRRPRPRGLPRSTPSGRQRGQVLGDAEGEGGAVAAAAGDGSALETMDALAKVSDRYALDADAVSHLEDCNGLITGLSSYLGMIGVAALIIALVLGFRKQFAALAFMLRMGPALLLAVLVVLGLWGVIDFNGLFAAFHSLFFVDGTWTFNYDSLLISMYPIDFWMGMGRSGSARPSASGCSASPPAACSRGRPRCSTASWKRPPRPRPPAPRSAARRAVADGARPQGPQDQRPARAGRGGHSPRGAVLRRRAHDDRRGDRALAGGGSRRRLQDPRDPGQVRRLLRVPRARGRRARPEEGGRGGRREGHRHDQGPRASAAHRLRTAAAHPSA